MRVNENRLTEQGPSIDIRTIFAIPSLGIKSFIWHEKLMATPTEGEPPSPLVPDFDSLQGPDYINAPLIQPSDDALSRGWSYQIDGNRLDFLVGGTARMEAVLNLIESAETSLSLLYYMFKKDSAGERVMAALMRALDRGVAVRIVIDSFGSSDTPTSFFDAFCKAGGDYRVFSTKWRSAYLIRNHQKLLIADGKRLITGGFNIADDYFGEVSHDNSWHDLGVIVEGIAVQPMVDYFEKLHHWVSTPHNGWKNLRMLIHTWDRNIAPEEARRRLIYSAPTTQTGKLRWLVGGPTRRLNPWAKAIKADLEHGQRLDMVEAYFAPGQGMLRRIARIARTRKGATLVLPSKSDNGATIGAARILYGYLLKRDAHIYEFAPCKLHMKLIVIDNITYIGSANFDMRSLYINMELMLRIEDETLASQMRAFIGIHTDHSDVITRAEHKRKLTWLNRLRWSLAYFIVAVMDYSVTRRLNFGIDN